MKVKARFGLGAALAAALALGAPRVAAEEATAPKSPAAAPAPPFETPWFGAVYDGAVDAVVRVECGDGFGAGFLFQSSRYVATAFHVVALGRDVTVRLRDGRALHAEVVATDRRNDVALLDLGEPL